MTNEYVSNTVAKCTLSKTIFWVATIAVASYLSPQVGIFNAFEKELHVIPPTLCQAALSRHKFYMSSAGDMSPTPFKNIYLPIYSSHNLGYSRTAGIFFCASLIVHQFQNFHCAYTETYFCETIEAVRNSPNTIVIVPWFAADQMFDDDWGSRNDTLPMSASLYWSTSNWMKGKQYKIVQAYILTACRHDRCKRFTETV